MSASTMVEKGKKTREKILKALSTNKPKSPAHVAERAKVSTDYARATLAALSKGGDAPVEAVKVSRSIHYKLKAQTADAGAVQ